MEGVEVGVLSVVLSHNSDLNNYLYYFGCSLSEL